METKNFMIIIPFFSLGALKKLIKPNKVKNKLVNNASKEKIKTLSKL